MDTNIFVTIYEMFLTFSWIFAQIFTLLSLFYVLWKQENYNKEIVYLLVFLNFTGLTWQFLPSNFSDMLYDMSYIFVCYVLLFYNSRTPIGCGLKNICCNKLGDKNNGNSDV